MPRREGLGAKPSSTSVSTHSTAPERGSALGGGARVNRRGDAEERGFGCQTLIDKRLYPLDRPRTRQRIGRGSSGESTRRCRGERVWVPNPHRQASLPTRPPPERGSALGGGARVNRRGDAEERGFGCQTLINRGCQTLIHKTPLYALPTKPTLEATSNTPRRLADASTRNASR